MEIRRHLATTVALFALAASSLVARDAHAVDPKYLCNPSGSQCVSVTPTDWEFSPQLWSGNYPPGTPFSSFSAAVSGLEAAQNYCERTSTGVDIDYVPGPWFTSGTSPAFANGLPYMHQHRLRYRAKLAPCPATNTPFSDYALPMLQARTLKCPDGYSLIYAAGPPVIGPYCAKPWEETDPGKCPGCKGGVEKGNPIDVGSGNKRQRESDYRAGGASPLGFTRYFNSWLAGAIGTTPASASGALPPTRVGLAWSADYFQSIRYYAEGTFASAFVFRPNGERIAFNESGGVFQPSVDVDYTLTAQRDPSGAITGWTLKSGTDVTEIYDANGNLLSIAERNGITQTLQYSNGLPASVTDSFGNQLQFNFTGTQLSSITLPGGSTIAYGYTSGRLTSVTDAANNVRQYHYEISGGPYLTGVTDENLSRYSTFGYDSLMRPTSTEHAGGVNRYSVSYGNPWSRSVTDPLGKQRTYSFTIMWNAARQTAVGSTCPGCTEPKSATYDANANLASKRDFNNNLTCYAHDLTRNLETVRVEGFAPSVASCPASLASYTPASGTRERKITTTWHSTFREPTSITEANRTTSFTYDANGNVLTRTVTDTSVTPNVARIWTYTYTSFGRVLTENGPRTDVSDVTTYSYYTCTTGYQCGQLHTVTNALGHATSYDSYNASGQPTQITDPNGLVTSLAYDARQRLKDRCVGGALPSCSGGELTHLDYWPTGLLKKVTTPDGSYIEYTYDAAHRLTQINDGALNKVVHTLDNMGNRTAENTYDPSNALRRTHSRVFNTLNQPWKDVNAAGTSGVTTTFTYDANGNQTAVAAPLSRNSSNLYDELNRLNQITDPASGITQFGYDANDNLSSVTDPRNLVTSYSYTGFGDLKTQTSPDTGLTTNTYDSSGNLKTSTDARNAITTYTYDVLNRVKTAAFKIGSTTDQTITYTYDAGTNGKGHLTSASDANHSLSWTYDAKGRLTAKGQTVGPVTKSMGYGYNASGQLTSLVLPSGVTVQYGYNSNNQVTSVSLLGSPNLTILSNITYEPFGAVRGWTWGSGRMVTRTFDTDGKLTAINTSLAAHGDRTFGYDDAFRITSTTDTATGAPSWTLGYDALDRLHSASKSGATLGYTYDANGNRLSQTGTGASTYTVSGTSNKLSSVSGGLTRSYTYDAIGSVLTSGATTHTYYNSGRMKSTKLGAASATTYIYNALGQRARKAGGTAATTHFMYDEAGHLVGEYSTSGSTVRETVWLGDIPIAVLLPSGSPATVYYIHTDQLNTPRKITNSNSSLTLRWSWDPNPFGDGAANESPTGLATFTFHQRFPGQYFDAESNLYYNYFRDYDPATGGYAESDPIGLKGGMNTYGYVKNRPISSIDPFGLKARICCRKIPSIFIPAAHCFVQEVADSPPPEQSCPKCPSQNRTIGLQGPPPWGSSGYPHAGEIHTNDPFDNPGESTCGEWNTDCQVGICIDQVVANYANPSKYNAPFGPNSNTFAGTISRACGIPKPRGKWPTPGWSDDPASPK